MFILEKKHKPYIRLVVRFNRRNRQRDNNERIKFFRPVTKLIRTPKILEVNR